MPRTDDDDGTKSVYVMVAVDGMRGESEGEQQRESHELFVRDEGMAKEMGLSRGGTERIIDGRWGCHEVTREVCVLLLDSRVQNERGRDDDSFAI